MAAITDLPSLINSQPEKDQLPQLKSARGLAPNPWAFVFPISIGVGGLHLGMWGSGGTLVLALLWPLMKRRRSS